MTSERFWSRVTKQPNGCWTYKARESKMPYAYVQVDGYPIMSAHRYAYMTLVGGIPEGLVIDHLCRATRCVNPEHLEAVTRAENTRRGIGPSMQLHRANVCKYGHSLEDAYVRNGMRHCRPCRRRRLCEHYRRHSDQRRADEQARYHAKRAALNGGDLRPRGEQHHQAKLTWQQVETIRAARQSGVPLKALAAEYGVSVSAVHEIVRGLTWRTT